VTEEVHVAVGAPFDIALPAVPTAGFKWQLSIPPQAEGVINYMGMAWETPTPPAPGGTSLQRFRFKAVGPGKTSLVFRYGRQWEGSDHPVKTVSVTVDSA